VRLDRPGAIYSSLFVRSGLLSAWIRITNRAKELSESKTATGIAVDRSGGEVEPGGGHR
jgi:hypothetical protein